MDTEKNYFTPYTVDLFALKGKNDIASYMERVRQSPPSILKILTDDATADFLEDTLGPSFQLQEPQIEELTRLVRDVLLGDFPMNDLTGQVGQRLGIDAGTAQQIRDRIVKELFAPAANDVKQMRSQRFPERQSAQPSTSVAPLTPPPPPSAAPDVNRNNVIDLRNQSKR